MMKLILICLTIYNVIYGNLVGYASETLDGTVMPSTKLPPKDKTKGMSLPVSPRPINSLIGVFHKRQLRSEKEQKPGIVKTNRTNPKSEKTLLYNQTMDDVANTGTTSTINKGDGDVSNSTQSLPNFNNDTAGCILSEPISSRPITYTSTALTVEIVTVNSVVLMIFLKKKNRSPLTVLLSSLAITDTLTCLLISVPELIVLLLGKITSDQNGIVWHVTYPLCVPVYVSYALGLTFHEMSIFITSILCVQKLISVICPLWSKIYLTIKVAILTSLLVLLSSILLNSPYFIVHLYVYKGRNETCCLSKNMISLALAVAVFVPWVIYFLCIPVVLICTITLCCKLTCCRRSLAELATASRRQRTCRSAVIVSIIGVIFILTELLILIEFIEYIFAPSTGLSDLHNWLHGYEWLSLQIGFSLNFIVYLVMGEQLRTTLLLGLRDICTKCSR